MTKYFVSNDVAATLARIADALEETNRNLDSLADCVLNAGGGETAAALSRIADALEKRSAGGGAHDTL